ncbi:MAG: DEAD/DEAH box helicase [Promethearchaeota archaeon]
MSWENISEIIKNFIQNKLNEPINKENALNENQRRAIRMIWEASMRPRITRGRSQGSTTLFSFIRADPIHLIDSSNRQFSSYIIIGPPGTGKTTVIAYGALLYISNPRYRRSRPRVFLCTSSNYGADRIFEKILEILHDIGVNGWEIFIRRIVAQSVEEDDISESVRNHIIRPRPSMHEDPRDHRLQLDNCLIFVGTIYACNDLLELRPNIRSQTVIFDEASQLTPPEMYLSISRNESIRSFGLVGDDCQLPPIASLEPLTYSCIDYLRGLPLFDNSRIPRRNQITLNIQYRMHPAIRDISSKFAKRNVIIEDSESVRSRTHLLQDYQGFEGFDFKNFLDDIFNPQKTVVVIDTSYLGEISLDTRERSSRVNRLEIDIINGLSLLFKTGFPNYEINDDNFKIVAPYKPQARELRNITGLNANTVDAFQGQEAEVVFYSLTFAEPDVKSRFMQNRHRLLVGLSRAQKKLIIIGNQSAMDRSYFEYLRNNIFNYNYNENIPPNVRLGYDPVSHISITSNFYDFLLNIIDRR